MADAVPPLADHVPDAPHLGWYLGLGIGSLVVVVVAGLVGSVLAFASRVDDRTHGLHEAFEQARDDAAPLADAERATASAARALADEMRAVRPPLREG